MDDSAPRVRRFFVEQLPARAGEPATLPPSETHHALHVLRLKKGAEVELLDGRGGSARGAILQAARSQVSVEVAELLPPQPRPAPAVCVAFSEPKGSRMDWLLAKATELGAAALAPVRFARSVAGQEALSESRRERWRGHCIAAAKQCGLNFLPEIREPAALAAFLKSKGEALGVLGDLAPSAVPFRQALAGRRHGQGILVLVGPEGGLTEEERSDALAAGFVPARLGPTTLRTETAAIALLAAATALCES